METAKVSQAKFELRYAKQSENDLEQYTMYDLEQYTISTNF